MIQLVLVLALLARKENRQALLLTSPSHSLVTLVGCSLCMEGTVTKDLRASASLSYTEASSSPRCRQSFLPCSTSRRCLSTKVFSWLATPPSTPCFPCLPWSWTLMSQEKLLSPIPNFIRS